MCVFLFVLWFFICIVHSTCASLPVFQLNSRHSWLVKWRWFDTGVVERVEGQCCCDVLMCQSAACGLRDYFLPTKSEHCTIILWLHHSVIVCQSLPLSVCPYCCVCLCLWTHCGCECQFQIRLETYLYTMGHKKRPTLFWTITPHVSWEVKPKAHL